MGGRLRAWKSPTVEWESRAPHRTSSEPARGTAANTDDTKKLALRFHFSGRGEAVTRSLPITTKVPSLSSVISIRLSTGIAKKLGQGPDAGSSGKRKALERVGDLWLNLLGGSAKAAMKKKRTR